MEEGNWVYGFLLSEFPQVKFEIIDMPTYQGKRSGMIFTVGWGINAASAKRDMATKWVQYVTGPEGMYNWTLAAGPLPTRPDVSAKIEPQLSPGLRTHIDQIPFSTTWVMGKFTSIINDAFMNFMGAAMEGTISVQEAMRNADEQANLQIGFAR
jgi:multiple sugar transport system substrate-binding protein